MTQAPNQAQTQTKKKEYVPVEISPETRRLLAVLKAAHGFRSYDELIRHLIKSAGYENI
jgi:hypothetical protein